MIRFWCPKNQSGCSILHVLYLLKVTLRQTSKQRIAIFLFLNRELHTYVKLVLVLNQFHIVKCPKSDHVSPLLRKLHWLPISCRIEHKTSSLCYSSLSGTGPQYLSDLIQVYTSSRCLRFHLTFASLEAPLLKPSPMVSAPLHSRVLPYGINCPWKSSIRAQLMA